MAYTKIVVDGETVIDRDIGEWTKAVPELEQYIRPNGQENGGKPKPEAWMQATLVLMAQAMMKGEAFRAEITTAANGFLTIKVKLPNPMVPGL